MIEEFLKPIPEQPARSPNEPTFPRTSEQKAADPYGYGFVFKQLKRLPREPPPPPAPVFGEQSLAISSIPTQTIAITKVRNSVWSDAPYYEYQPHFMYGLSLLAVG